MSKIIICLLSAISCISLCACSTGAEQINTNAEEKELSLSDHYDLAIRTLEQNENETALNEFLLAVPYEDSIEQARSLRDFSHMIAASSSISYGIGQDGSSMATGEGLLSQNEVLSWTDIIQFAGGSGFTHALKQNGTVEACGSPRLGNQTVKDWVKGWEDIVKIAVGENHVVGLKSNGTVVANGWSGGAQLGIIGSNGINYNDGGGEKCNVSDWNNIIDIAAGNSHTVGLKSDGTVIVIGGYDEKVQNVEDWDEIIAIAAGANSTIGLKSDGTVLATGSNIDGQYDVSEWSGIIDISVGRNHLIGLRSDGTVVATGNNNDGQCDVSDWENIIAIAAGDEYSLGITSFGTVLATGSNNFGQCDVQNWKLW